MNHGRGIRLPQRAYDSMMEPSHTDSTVNLVLELYFDDADRPFAEAEAAKLKYLLASLAPHIHLDVQVLEATDIVRSTFAMGGRTYNVPNQNPTSHARQSLLITAEDLGGHAGLAGPGRGCVSKSELQKKTASGADSAEITIHEWLHTLEGKQINGRFIPSPDSNSGQFQYPSSIGRDGMGQWFDWYKHLLRW